MCGIAAFAGEDEQRMRRMVACLRHRGPDGDAFVVAHGASLGHARLAILDPRPVGDQPMWNERHTVVIVYNGEIFNYRELRETFALDCKTGTDTEVLLKLYEREGIDFVRRLRGMFAFALYDTRAREWHLARDPSGIKPLFVAYPGGKLHCASEMRSLLSAMPGKPTIDETSLSLFLRLQYVPGPRTMCEGIESLPPGTVLRWKDGDEERRILAPHIERPSFPSKAAFKEALPALMDKVVNDHLVSDKPVGLFLSGGMDSSAVLHHMANHAEKPVRTFTVRFEASADEGEARFNADANLAAMTARHYGTEHEEILLTAQLCRELYKETARALDQPNADAVSTAQFLLSRVAKKKVDVVLTGAGGDELFGGYPRYRVARILRDLRWLPAGLRAGAGALAGHPSDVLRMQPGPALAERLLARPITEVASVAKPGWFDPDATTALFADRFKPLDGMEDVRAFMEFDRALWLVDESLRLADATTMASGLEGRVPFLDPLLIQASLATPAGWHVGWKRTKALFKDVYRSVLPAHLFTLKKASFYPPLAKWIRREAAPLVEEMLENPRIKERFDAKALRVLFEKHKARETYALHTLSSLMQLGYWFETVYDA
jgi:asparagine synthase (glutamine-hydrolysing)